MKSDTEKSTVTEDFLACLAEIRLLRAELAEFKKGLPASANDATLSSEEVIRLLKIRGDSHRARLQNLSRRAGKLGISPLPGGRGKSAAWPKARVLAAINA